MYEGRRRPRGTLPQGAGQWSQPGGRRSSSSSSEWAEKVGRQERATLQQAAGSEHARERQKGVGLSSRPPDSTENPPTIPVLAASTCAFARGWPHLYNNNKQQKPACWSFSPIFSISVHTHTHTHAQEQNRKEAANRDRFGGSVCVCVRERVFVCKTKNG